MKGFLYFCTCVLLCVSCAHTGSAAKYPNKLADIDPFSIGLTSASLDQTFSSKVKATDVEVIFYPRENEVALEFNLGQSQYRQFWNEAGRRLFIEAFGKYKEDFANRELLTNFNRSRAIYGKFTGRFLWKTLSFSATYSSSPVIQLGYRFREGSPYFSASQRKAKEETGFNRMGISESPAYSLYFTRAQGEELLSLFDQAFLLGLLKDSSTQVTDTAERDEYF